MSEPRIGRVFRRISLLLAIPTVAFVISLGPAPHRVSAQTGQPYTWHNVVTGGGGGFIPGIVFNTSQRDLIYARTDIGGAYRWNPSTNSWIPLMDFVSFADWNTLGVESIATDPVDPNRFYVAAGLYTNFFTTSNGAILRSSDQGNTFERTDLPFKTGGNMPGRSMGERLVIDPNSHNILLLGARSGNGLWKSSDFGATWNKVAGFTAQATYVQQAGDAYLGDTDGVVWEFFDPRTGTAGNPTQTIYAGIADKGNSIFRSSDAGVTWAAVPGQPTGFLPHHGVLGPDGNLYITYSNGAGPFDGTSGDVWKLATATGVWTRISPVPSTDTANDYFGYGGLAVDVQHPGTIMVSALNSWWPDTILFRSTNSGATWTRIWDWASYPNRTLRYVQSITAAPWLNFGITNPVPPVPAPKLGWMVGCLVIDPLNSDRMMYGTGATLYGSNDLTLWDSGGTIHISSMASGIEETSVLDLISPPAGAPLFSAQGDVGGFRHDSVTTAPASMFTAPIFTTGTSIDYAELNTNFIARVGTVDKTLSPAPNSSGFSFDGGTSWFQGNSEPGGITTGGGTIAAAANASRVVWCPANSGVFFSADNGNSWTASAGVTSGGRVASDRVNPAKFYAFAGGAFYVSTNGGTSFTATGAVGLPRSGDPVRFRAVPGIEGDIWLAGGSAGSGVYGLWHSTNSGATFTRLANVQQADTIGLGKAAPGKSYPALFANAQIGGVRGIFRSDDEGATWIRINDDQHQWGMANAAITGDPRIYGRVYISTNGRGIIYGDIAGALPADFSLSANPTSVSITRGASGTSTVTVNPTGGFAGSVTFSASGLPAGVTASVNPASSGTATTLTLSASSTATTGSATVTVTGTSGSLTHATPISLTVNPITPADYSLSASPASLTVGQGSSGTNTVTITRTGGFNGSVAFSASGLPSGVTANFNPTPTTGNSTTLTLAASSTATTGSATVTVTGTSGSLSHAATIALTVSPGGGSGGVTATPVVSSSGPWFNEEDIKLSNTVSLTALSITIVVQRTTGVSFNGQYNTVGSQITQSNTSTASAVTFQYALGSGQTLGAGTGWTFGAQTSGSGTVHPTTGDTFSVTFTTSTGVTQTISGHF